MKIELLAVVKCCPIRIASMRDQNGNQTNVFGKNSLHVLINVLASS